MKNFNKTRALGLALLLGPILSLSPTIGHAHTRSLLYAIDNEHPYLAIVDPSTGAKAVENELAISVLGDSIVVSTGLAVHPLTNEMYAAVELDSAPSGQSRSLIKINPESGQATVIGLIGLPIASLAFTDDGVLFGVTGDCSRCSGNVLPETLYTINTTNGVATFFQSLGNGGDGEAIAFNPVDGMMYHMSGVGGTDLIFEKINLTTHVVTPIPLTGYSADQLEAIGFTWDREQNLFVGSLIDCFCNVSTVRAYVTLTPAGFLTQISSLPHWWKDYAFYEAPDLYLESLSDVNDNGAADMVVLAGEHGPATDTVLGPGVHAYVKDGMTGGPIWHAKAFNERWQAMGLAVTPDGANSLVAVLAQRDDNLIKVALYRASTGLLVRRITFFNVNWVPSAIVFVPQAGGPGGSAFAVVAKNINDDRIAVQLRRRSDGGLLNTTTYFSNSWDAIGLATIDDISGNDRPEVIVLGRSDLGRIVAVIRDAATRALVNKIPYLGKTTVPKAIDVIADIGSSAAPELPVLGERANGQAIVQTRDSATDQRVGNVAFLNPHWIPIDLRGLDDVNGNSSADLVVLAQHASTGAIKSQVRDASTGDLIKATKFLAPAWDARALAAFDDINGNSLQELGVVARRPDGAIRVQIRDASSGTLVKTAVFP